MLVFEEGGKPENPEKNPWSKGENQQQTQSTYDARPGNRTQDTLVVSECSQHCATPAPPSTCRRYPHLAVGATQIHVQEVPPSTYRRCPHPPMGRAPIYLQEIPTFSCRSYSNPYTGGPLMHLQKVPTFTYRTCSNLPIGDTHIQLQELLKSTYRVPPSTYRRCLHSQSLKMTCLVKTFGFVF